MQTLDLKELFIRSGTEESYDTHPTNKVIKQLSDWGIRLSLDKGPYLAGGAVRELVLNGVPRDYDVFFFDEEQYKNVRNIIKCIEGIEELHKNQHNVSYRYQKYKIQLILLNYYKSSKDLLESFDFSLCQLVTDGKALHLGDYTLWDIARKRLVVETISYGVSSIRRMLKYTRGGYTLCGGSIQNLLEQIVADPSIINSDIQYID